MQILYLCSQNKRRSLTAEKVLNEKDGHVVRSAGTSSNARIKVTPGLIGWADIIVTMEKKYTQAIRKKYNEELKDKKIICLYIPDDYMFMDERLIELLEDSFEDVISN